MLPEIITDIPGPRSLALGQELRRYECRNVTYIGPKFPVFWQRAHGVNVWDLDGNRFLDLTSGFGVAGLGYTPPTVVEAAQAQLPELYHAMGDVHPAAVKVELCRELSHLTFESWGAGEGQTILTNSGSEAVEAALKTAYLATKKRGVIAFQGAYHGLTYGALTVSGLTEFRDPFVGQLGDWLTLIPFPNCGDCVCHEVDRATCAQRCEAELHKHLAGGQIGAILTEPIQGRAGVRVPPDWFLPLLRRVADAHGVLLIVDEIYTGFYRTGSRFALDAVGVVPDVICLGKALTSGFPLAACVGRKAVMEAWPVSDGEALHTSTFLGNPLGCRMALAALSALETGNKDEEWQTNGLLWQRGLQALQAGSVRGRGLLWGVELKNGATAGQLVLEGLQRGLILLSGGSERNVLTVTPPFVMSRAEIEWACAEIGSILAA